MADIKTLLKDARKFIDEKNFVEAQECCKNILRKDKQNYLGLVLLGKSLQDSEQAPLAFQKAIACKSDHPLAWQGLANYYENKPDLIDKVKLLNVYSEIIKLQLENEKSLEVINKIGQLGTTLKCEEAIAILLEFLTYATDDTLKNVTRLQIKNLLKNNVEYDEKYIPEILNILYDLHDENPHENELLIAETIMKRKDFKHVAEEVIQLDFFSRNAAVRQKFCKFICQKYIEHNFLLNWEIEPYINQIIHEIESSKDANLLQSMVLYHKGEFLEAYKQCVNIVNYYVPDKTESIFILKCTTGLKKWSLTQKLASNFIQKTNDTDLIYEFKKFLFYGLAKLRSWNQAIEIAKDFALENLELEEKVILAECYIHKDENFEHILKSINSKKHIELLEALHLLKLNKFEECITLLESSDKDMPLRYFYLGKAYWELEQFQHCQLNLLKSAKSNPEHGDTFLYLGHYFTKHLKDLQKAKKCYEKAYNLCPNENDVMNNLSIAYSKLNEREKDFELLKNIVDQMKLPEEHWPYFRIGLHYLNLREWENAISSFRYVIKKNSKDAIAFECLADAYFSRGSYTSALRAYKRVISLDSTKVVHCQTRIAYIYALLTQYQEAISVFHNVLKLNPDSILALKGLSETWMRVAKKRMQANLFGNAQECAQQAVNFVMEAIKKRKEYICLWKLLADSLLFITKLPDKYAFCKINLFSVDESSRKSKLEIFPQLIACYAHIAKKKQQMVSYDLASSYLKLYTYSKKTQDCQVAYKLTIDCIRSKPLVWRNWNLLGKIALHTKKYDVAQHCFIKALLLTRKWSIAKVWCNLGTLYLQVKQYKLANYCYWRGQSTLPSYSLSWIGQGLIAEAIREEEAMDLFRHAARLGYHRESALGYADWVCRTLKNNSHQENPDYKYVIESLYAIPYAADLVQWFVTYESEDSGAYTILGILQERLGNIKAAFNSYESAFKNAKDTEKNIALLNLGRIYIRLQRYEDAIVTYKAITEASLDSVCGLALALFKKELYEESYSAYDAALHWLSNEDKEKSDVLVAMAGIMYLFKGPDDAKTLLFHSIQISQKKPTAHSLFAICSLGLLHSDQSLSKLALTELRKYSKDNNYCYELGFLKSYILMCEGSQEKAIKSLSESLHDFPNNASLWYCMAQYCLKTARKAKIAGSCALKALYSAKSQGFHCNPAQMIATASIAEHVAGEKTKAFRIAIEGFHLYPQSADMWAALLYSLISHDTYGQRKKWLNAATSYMRRHLNMSQSLNKWVTNLEKKI